MPARTTSSRWSQPSEMVTCTTGLALENVRASRNNSNLAAVIRLHHGHRSDDVCSIVLRIFCLYATFSVSPYSVYGYSDDYVSSLRDFSFTYIGILSAANSSDHHDGDEDMSSPLLGNCVPNNALSVATGTRIDNITDGLSSMINSKPRTYTSALVGPAPLK